jgi:hypothetical protein
VTRSAQCLAGKGIPGPYAAWEPHLTWRDAFDSQREAFDSQTFRATAGYSKPRTDSSDRPAGTR